MVSKLEELINKYCPNGVEFEKLGNLVNISTGKLNANAMVENGEYMFFTCDAQPYRIDNYAFDTEAILISGNGSQVGHINYYKGKFNAYQRTYVLDNFKKVTAFYLRFYLDNYLRKYIELHSRKGSVPYITLPMLQNFKVAVPPMEIQCEIVHILDDFTLLSAELSAELKARQEQYNYYRDSIFKFSGRNDVKWLKLSDIYTEMFRGAGIKRDELTDDGIPCVRYGEIYTTYNIWFDKCVSKTSLDYVKTPKYFENNDILFAITGESIEDIGKSIVYIGNEKCLAGGDIIVMKHKQNGKYISYALSTTNAIYQKGIGRVKSKVVHTNYKALSDIVIPIPSLKEQAEIVEKLDKFYKLINDISDGLPAEIEARRLQYEYYRDKILNFKEIK